MVIKGFDMNGMDARGENAAVAPVRALAALLLLGLTGGCRVR